MPNNLTSIQSQILNKHKTAVEALSGQPLRKGYWKKTKPPQGADAAAIAAFESSVLDEIWIYSTGRVHFTLADGDEGRRQIGL
jgi:hypothetical protein